MPFPIRNVALSLLGFAAALPVLAQTAQPQPPLLPPAGLYYQYWPLQIVQWVGPELPYSTILLYVDDRPKEPLYDAVLTDRATGKRTHYANTPALVAEDKAKGDDAFLTRMQFDPPAAPAKGAQYMLRFNTEKNVPVLWQFVQGTDVSEQGSGLTPVEAPFPVLLYREQGALATEGTALKVGNVTSTADVWKELSHPPYFMPYHGALTQGAHILSIVPVASRWTDPQPAAFTEGATWKLTSALGTMLTAQAAAAKGPGVTVSLTSDAHATSTTLEAQQTAAGSAVSRVRFGPAGAKPEHTLSLVFSPALAPGVDSKFDIVAGKKTKIAAGSVQTSAEAGGTTEKWSMTSPDAVKGKSATASASVQP